MMCIMVIGKSSIILIDDCLHFIDYSLTIQWNNTEISLYPLVFNRLLDFAAVSINHMHSHRYFNYNMNLLMCAYRCIIA